MILDNYKPIFEKGDIVVCVCDWNGYTYGKQYPVLSQTIGSLIDIESDLGDHTFPCIYGYPNRVKEFYFIGLDKYREMEINKVNEIQKLEILMESYEGIYDEIYKKHWDVNYKMIEDGLSYDTIKRWGELQSETKEIRDKMSEIGYKLKVLEPIEYNDLPDYGDHMTFDHFKNCCESGGFISGDGSGMYATEDKESNKSISPSDFKNDRILEGFSHVVWYNK